MADHAPHAPAPAPRADELRSVALGSIDARRERKTDDRALRQRELAARLADFQRTPVPVTAEAEITATLHRAAGSGEMRADVFRFPSEYCTDLGRAINNGEPDWPATLQGLALRYLDLLRASFHPLGYRIGAEIVTWPMLMPGDVALILTWYDDDKG